MDFDLVRLPQWCPDNFFARTMSGSQGDELDMMLSHPGTWDTSSNRKSWRMVPVELEALDDLPIVLLHFERLNLVAL